MDESDRMIELYEQNIAKGMSEDDAYGEAHSVICNQACEKYGPCENGDGSLE